MIRVVVLADWKSGVYESNNRRSKKIIDGNDLFEIGIRTLREEMFSLLCEQQRQKKQNACVTSNRLWVSLFRLLVSHFDSRIVDFAQLLWEILYPIPRTMYEINEASFVNLTLWYFR